MCCGKTGPRRLLCERVISYFAFAFSIDQLYRLSLLLRYLIWRAIVVIFVSCLLVCLILNVVASQALAANVLAFYNVMRDFAMLSSLTLLRSPVPRTIFFTFAFVCWLLSLGSHH